MLGPPCWQIGSRLRPFAPERPYQLLAWLGHHGDWVSRERLAALFWPGHDPTAARRNLRKVLFRLRDISDFPAIEERGHMLRWPVATDLLELESAVDAGAWAAAATLWRGEPWEGLKAETLGQVGAWLTFERQRLFTRWRHIVLQAAAHALESPGHEACATSLAQRLLAVDSSDPQALGILHRAQALQPQPVATSRMSAPMAQSARSALPFGSAVSQDFVGRQAELAQIREALSDPDCRWITIVGPGGIGKTSLLARALASLSESGSTSDAGVFVTFQEFAEDLSAASPDAASAHLGLRILEALGIVPGSDTSFGEQLAYHLGPRHLILGLDNLEHLPHGAHALARALADLPGVRVVATSRERLHIPGERLFRLQGLPWPSAEDAARVGAFDAAQLFARRASRHLPQFDLEAQAPDVAALCEAVEGLPLALELAAAWTRHFPVREIVAELRRGTGELLSEASAAGTERPARQRGMRACIEHSFGRLTESERILLTALSVLRASFSLDAARQIGGADLLALGSLLDKSLLRNADELADSPRFSLHPLIQQFAAFRLAQEPQRESEVRRRMAGYYLRLLAALPPATRAREHQTALRGLAGEAENLVAAWDLACEEGLAELLAPALPALRALQHLRAHWEEGLAMLDRSRKLWSERASALDHAPAQIELARASFENGLGRFESATRRAEALLRFWRRIGDAEALRQALMIAGHGRQHTGDYEMATRWMEQGLASAREDADLAGAAAFLTGLASLDFHHGRFALCTQRGREAVQLLRATGGDPATVLGKLSMNLIADGRLDEALQALDDALQGCPPRVHLHRHTTLLLCAGLVHCRRRDWTAAEQQLERTEALLTGARPARLHYFVELLRARIAAGRGQGDEAHRRMLALTDFCLRWGSLPAQATLAADWGRWYVAQGEVERGRVLLDAALKCPDLDAGERHWIRDQLAELPVVETSPRAPVRTRVPGTLAATELLCLAVAEAVA